MSNRPKHYKPSVKPKCGAKTRAGGGHPCGRSAGHGTNHLGMGRCKYHGGATPTKHGLYSKVMPTVYKEACKHVLVNADPESLREHIALIDSVILPEGLKRLSKRPKLPGQMDPVELLVKAIDMRSKLLMQLHKMKLADKVNLEENRWKDATIELLRIVEEVVGADVMRTIIQRAEMALIAQERNISNC